MNSDQNNRTNRDQEQVAQRKSGISPTTQAASEQAAAGGPGSAGSSSPGSHRDFDEADLRKPSPMPQTAEEMPDNQEGIGP